MANRRVLVQWIGHSDLQWLASTLGGAQRAALLAEINRDDVALTGPTSTLLKNESFDDVLLLSNYKKKWNDIFVKALGDANAKCIKVALDRPTDYTSIYEIACAELNKLKAKKDWAKTELCLHLSPGTPAMTAVWVLLGKTQFPATFYESFRTNSSQTQIPFDLTLDVIPALLRDPDSNLHHLASEAPSEIAGFEDIIGESRAICDAVGRAKRAAVRSVSVLLLGESGTGKEMFANAIRQASPRRSKKFTAINCATLSGELLRSELFGHSKGAFTGAMADKKGAFEIANGGTIFLDEVGECDLSTQAQLLRALQPNTKKGPSIRTIQRLGDGKETEVDVRIIAATNQDLRQQIKDGEFREDLFYRLATITITLPPLRDRKADIAILAERLLDQINGQFENEEPDYQHKNLSASAKSFVKRHDWPGNVRQLYNALVQAAVLCENQIERADIESALAEMPHSDSAVQSLAGRPLGDGFDLEKHINDVRIEYLTRSMEEADAVKAEAARLLGMKNYQTLDAQLKKFKIAVPKKKS